MKYLLGATLCLCAFTMPTSAATPITVSQMRCENVLNPLGVDTAHPRLSWQLSSRERGIKQSAFHVLVASRPELLAKSKADLWDSGQIKSTLTNEIIYGGKPLESGMKCYWKVRVWDNQARQSPFSKPATWEMGLLHKSDWHGQWIGYTPPKEANKDAISLQGAQWVWFPEGNPLNNAPQATRFFRRTFNIEPGHSTSRGRLRVAADNDATIFVNGREVGRSRDTWKTLSIFDVGPYLTSGANTIAISVANEGSAAGLAARLNVDFGNDTPFTLVSDSNWKTSTDAPPDWQDKGFDDSKWLPAKEIAKVGEGPWGEVSDTGYEPAPPAPHLRRTFDLNGKVKRATAYIVGLGYYELSINGRKVGDHMLDPGWTRYDRRSLYVVHDVTSYLKNGANALGVILGTGHYDDHVPQVWGLEDATWRTSPKLLLEMRVDYEDGRSQTIISDGTWKASTGPIIFDSISAGERYDARLEMKGWDTTSYKADNWKNVEVVEPVKGVLTAQVSAPIRVVQSITPVKVTEPKPGVWLFDLGQNIAGIPQLRVNGPAGTKVVMKCAEKLHPDGTLDASSIDKFVLGRNPSQQFQTDTYILKGLGREVWNPRFTYHGFQYVEVTGFPGRPTADNIRGLVMHTNFAEAGTFECSDSLLNKIQQMSLWSYRNNFHSIPTDCPQREKNGWTGDAQLAAEMGLYNFDGAANYEKWLDDIADEQGDKGDFAGIIPTSGWGYDIGPAWDSAYPLIAWYLYQYRGDKKVIEKHYSRLARYVDFLSTRAKDGIVDYGLGDWVPAKTQTPADITSTAYYFVDADILSKMAHVLGNSKDEKKYADLAASIKTAFNAKFYQPESGIYGNGSITSLSCALYQGLVEPENKQKVLDNLVAEIKKQNYNMDVGILGAKYVLNTLAENGRIDIAYQMLQKRTLPSYGYWIEQGATTLWEVWDGTESLNHIMFGDVSAWFYKYLAGINAASSGFREIVIKPHVVGDLTFARASHDSVQGRIVSGWKLTNGTFQLTVTIPPNSSGKVYIPARDVSKVMESGQTIKKSVGVKLLRQEKDYVVYTVESGTYRFSCPFDLGRTENPAEPN